MDDDEIPEVAHGPLVVEEREAVAVDGRHPGPVGQHADVGILVGEGGHTTTLGQDPAHGAVRQHVADAAGVRRVVHGRVVPLRHGPATVRAPDDEGVCGRGIHLPDVHVIVIGV